VGIKCKKGVVRVKYDQNTAVAGAWRQLKFAFRWF
jgi:hypothetical protein